MAKLVLIVLVIAAVVGGSYFFLNYEIQTRQAERLEDRAAQGRCGRRRDARPIRRQARFGRRIRIATFQLGRFDEAKLANPQVGDVLVRLFSQFDLVAVQGVRGKNQGVLVRLVEQINAATGRTYDFATCPTQQRDALEHYSAFVFDRGGSKSIARRCISSRIRWAASASSRWSARSAHVGPDPAEAFTFTLINVEVDPDRAGRRIGPAGRGVSRRARRAARRRTTSSCWAIWRATISTWASLASCWASRRCSPASPPPPAARNCSTTSCWTAGPPASSPAAWKSST